MIINVHPQSAKRDLTSTVLKYYTFTCQAI